MTQDRVQFLMDGTVEITETIEYTRKMSQVDYKLSQEIFFLKAKEKDILLNQIIPQLKKSRSAPQK